jgi:TonB family protein
MSIAGTAPSNRAFKALVCTLVIAFLFPGNAGISAQEQNSAPVLTKVIEAQLDSLASRVSEKIKKNNRDNGPVKVLVFDFTWNSPDVSSRLGTLLSDSFSEMLKAQSHDVEVVDRKLLAGYLEDTWTRIEDLKSNLACLEVARELGAAEIIRANLVEEGAQQLNVLVQVAGVEPPISDQARFLITSDMEALASQPSPSYVKPPDTIPTEPGVLVPGSDGVSWPRCIACPDPEYSEAARARKINGMVVLSAVVTTAGDVTSIYVLKPAPLGLTQRAMEAVKTWKLEPATKDGQPVAVRVPLETTFRVM